MNMLIFIANFSTEFTKGITDLTWRIIFKNYFSLIFVANVSNVTCSVLSFLIELVRMASLTVTAGKTSKMKRNEKQQLQQHK